MAEATQNYFTAQEALSSNREMLSVFQSAGNIECINCDSKLSAEQLNYMTVSKHNQQGHAWSLQNLLKCKSPCAACYGACLLSDMCVYFLNETQAELHIISTAVAVGDHMCLAGSRVLPCF